MDRRTRISAAVSRTTRESLERHARAMGVSMGHLVKQALRHHLRTLEEFPADVIVHPTLVLTRKSGEGLLKEIETAKPTGALRDLLLDGE